MNKDAFSGFHPAVNLCFFLAAMVITMFINHPVFLLISLLSSCGYLLYLQGKKGMLRQVGAASRTPEFRGKEKKVLKTPIKNAKEC